MLSFRATLVIGALLATLAGGVLDVAVLRGNPLVVRPPDALPAGCKATEHAFVHDSAFYEVACNRRVTWR